MIRSFSFGGGVQSMAVLVMASRAQVNYDVFLFCNVGDDSENPATLKYFSNVALPFAQAHNIKLIELKRIKRTMEVETVYGRIMANNRSICIPARMSNGAPGRRSCTVDFKIRVVAKWLKQHGATKLDKAITGLGISLDEFQRARTDSGIEWETLEYPLLTLRMTRQDCINTISNAGLPVPPKSSCYFCPFHSTTEWIRIRRDTPDLFQKSIEIEKWINKKRHDFNLGYGDELRLHPSLKPLEIAVGDQAMFDAFEICESGYCMV